MAYSLDQAQIKGQDDLNQAFGVAIELALNAIDSGAAAEKLSRWTAASQAD